MSTKNTIKYCNTKMFTFHLYNCFVNGFQFSIRVGNSKDYLIFSLTEQEAKEIEKELNRNYN